MSTKIFITFIASTLITSPCYAMEPEKPPINAAKMELVKQYGYIGYVIKQIGTTYDTNGSIKNLPLPDHITDQIIKYVKLDLTQNLKFEKIIPNPAEFPLFSKNLLEPKKYYSVAHNPCKPELAAGTINRILLWNLENYNNSYELKIPSDYENLTSSLINIFIYSPISILTYNPTGTRLASAMEDKIHIWDLTTKSLIHALDINRFVNSMVFNLDGTELNFDNMDKLYVFTITDKKLKSDTISSIRNIIRGPDGKITLAMENPHSSYSELAFNHNGTQLISGSCNYSNSALCSYYQITAHNLDKLGNQFPIVPHQHGNLTGLAYCQRINKYFLIINNSLHSMDPNNFTITKEEQLILKKGARERVSKCTFSDDGSKLARIIEQITTTGNFQNSYIRYIELVPDLNQYSIEKLRMMKNQQES